jgi:LuxR family transcriptional regulator, maltose regulon positive regulatory protein
VRRTLMPFLGWSRHGRPMAVLLQELARRHPTRWCEELASAIGQRTALTSLAGPMTATPQEQAHVATGATYVTLSPRERDVIHELARGSTYADIASNLFLSENTVKTHVSSVYSKLAVNRRSDALAVARTLHLL